MTSQIPKISGNCPKIKLQNFSILRYYSSICGTHTYLHCDKVFETAFYSLAAKTFAWMIIFNSIMTHMQCYACLSKILEKSHGR